MHDPTTEPGRVVDRDNYGWYLAGSADGGTYWTTGPNRHDTDYSGYGGLAAARGPLRPVLPVTDADRDGMRAIFALAGRKAVTSLAAALEAVYHRLNQEHTRSGPDLDGFGFAKRTMTAGRAGSWEAELLLETIWFGNGLNLAKPTRTLRASDIAGRRAAGPVARVDRDVRDALTAIIWQWVTDPARYTELAETLAYLVSSYADDQHGRGGWAAVADQWLQPRAALAGLDARTCYRLFYSTSQHRDPGAI